MPKRTSRKKRSPRRRVRRRRYNPRKAILSGFPSQKLVKLRYIDTNVTLDAGVGLTQEYVYRANSVFDPDHTGIGHQPMGFDQWAGIYNRYTVLGAKITVVYNPSAAGSVTAGYVGITLSGDTNPLSNYTSINNILESKLTGARTTITGMNQMLGKETRISKNFSAKKFFGVKDVQDGASLSALVGANPAKDAYFSVWQASIDGNNPASASLTVKIDYIVLMREPKNLDGS